MAYRWFLKGKISVRAVRLGNWKKGGGIILDREDIREIINEGIITFLEQLDNNGIDVDCVGLKVEYDDGFDYLKVEVELY